MSMDETTQSDWQVGMSSSEDPPLLLQPGTAQWSRDPPAGLTQQQRDKLSGEEHSESSEASGGVKPGQIRASHLLVKHRDSRRP